MPWPAILLLQHACSLTPQARRTPHAGYHGQGQTDFFEGWYSRITLPETDQSFAFIYAIFDPGRRTERSGVDAQVLASTADAAKAICASSTDCSPFAAAPHDLSLRYAGDAFSFAMTSVQHRGRLDGGRRKSDLRVFHRLLALRRGPA